jgi:fructose-1-phosphate kinase PfkB-like protein
MRGIEAIHHSEERYSSLTLVAFSDEQRLEIQELLKKTTELNEQNVQISESQVDEILETTIEYHDDYDKVSGVVFDGILKSLNVEICE